jgi:ribosomal protein S20
MFASLSCSFQALRCHAVSKQALKEAIKQIYKQIIKQASDKALIRCLNASRLSSGLHTAITAM